jgi:hypothetical protein
MSEYTDMMGSDRTAATDWMIARALEIGADSNNQCSLYELVLWGVRKNCWFTLRPLSSATGQKLNVIDCC